MGFLDKAKAAAEQAKTKAQEGVEQVQTKKETTQAYWDLGHKAYELASSGAISHPELDPLVQRIRDLESRNGGGQTDMAPSDTTATATPSEPTATATPGDTATATPEPAPSTAGAETVSEPEQATTATPPQTPA